MSILRIMLFFTISVFAISAPVVASLPPQEAARIIELSNRAIGKEIGDYTLIDQDGNRFALKEFKGKPFVISLIYTKCGHICPTITMNLSSAIREAGKDFGVKFTAITIGFDVENDTPQRMKEYGGNFTSDFKNWRFATADKATIERLTDNLGFYYKKDKEGFDHLNAVTVINAEGRIFSHVYGIDFKPAEVLQPVYESMHKAAIQKEIKPIGLLERVKLFCYKYDEATGKYKLDYPFLVGMLLEAITITAMILFVWGSDIKAFFSSKRFIH